MPPMVLTLRSSFSTKTLARNPVEPVTRMCSSARRSRMRLNCWCAAVIGSTHLRGYKSRRMFRLPFITYAQLAGEGRLNAVVKLGGRHGCDFFGRDRCAENELPRAGISGKAFPTVNSKGAFDGEGND